ncbi:MAG TPA: hypothetical protein PLC42_07385, partial [Parachlamydiaceae bacterium]|nr:hypothetical protein [Parachlamydiaceae bacterium]
GPNLYAYVHNNPLIYVDPYGLWAEELYHYAKEIGHSAARGFIDDTSFDASSYILGEHQTPTIASKAGYYLGTGTSMLVGVATGGTLGKAAKFCGKGLNFAYKSIKTALTASKNVKTLTASVKAVKLIESEAKVQKACQWFLKPKNVETFGNINKKRVSNSKIFVDQMFPEEAKRYENFWKKHAPEQATPYSTWRRYTFDGDIKQVTTYDQFGNRHRQYDLIDPRREPHQHNFEYGSQNIRPKGQRSGHLPIGE